MTRARRCGIIAAGCSMSIKSSGGVFLVSTPHTTYVMRLHDTIRGQVLVHCGWFGRLDEWTGAGEMPLVGRGFAGECAGEVSDEAFSLDTVMSEYPAGGTDYRHTAYTIENDGTNQCAELFYTAHRVYKGKRPLEGLPSTYVENDDEADTLEIDLSDPATGLTVTLVYTAWNTCDAICRHTVFRRKPKAGEGAEGSAELVLRSTMSASVDFCGGNLRLVTLSGAHARERHVDIRPLLPGVQGVVSRRGMGGHGQNPFIAIMEEDGTETTGTVYGMSLVYSGEFEAIAERDQFGTTRAQIGIGGHNFKWVLQADDVFTTPECVMVRSSTGLEGMSRVYHELYRTRLARGKWRDRQRPIVINNWEATYFDFDENKLLDIARMAAAAGVECFVLDDGWFGGEVGRNDDSHALGDWDVNIKKLPHGLGGLSDAVHEMGVKFGLWVEPEMVSPNSRLYSKHPNWCIHVDGRPRTLSRHQLVLDLSRADVVDYLAETFTRVFNEAKVDYVKWDYNRSPAWFEEGQSHLYYLGLYRLLETLTSRFPDVLFESCSGGGGRFDGGMLYYMPQTWCSDNTDAISRVSIQAGTSLVYPASSMSCHVSAVPNHQTGRITPIAMRGAVAMAGTFGYELDMRALTAAELEEVKAQCAWYRRIRDIVQFGDLYRLRTPYTDRLNGTRGIADSIIDYSAWEYVARDKRRAVVNVVWTSMEANAPFVRLMLRGLESNGRYRFINIEGIAAARERNSGTAVPSGMVATGAELMNAGLIVMATSEQCGTLHWLLEAI